MKRFLFAAFVGVLGATALLGAQPIPIYENFGVLTYNTNLPPQIDALAFANYGTFSVFTTLPFDFTDVQHYTNRGSMSGEPGFIFDTAFNTGKRVPAVDFVNASGATVTAVDGPPGLLGGNQAISPSFLTVSAANITAQGILSVGA